MQVTRQGFGRSTATVLALAVLASSAAADGFGARWKDGAPGCYARVYDAAHLAAHPRQRVTRFALGPSRLGAPVQTGEFEVTFSLTLKGGTAAYQSQGICRAAKARVRCAAEGDGGQFTIRPDGRNLLVTIDRLELEGEAGFTPDLGTGGDDRVLRLYPAPDSACRFNP